VNSERKGEKLCEGTTSSVVGNPGSGLLTPNTGTAGEFGNTILKQPGQKGRRMRKARG